MTEEVEKPQEIQEQPAQVSRIDRLVERQKHKWVLNEDYAVIKEDTRSLGTCSGCDTKHYCSHVDKHRRYYCGDCIGKLSGVDKVKKITKELMNLPNNPNILTAEIPNNIVRSSEPIMMKLDKGSFLNGGVAFESKPISNQIDLTVIISGKVYDLVVRDEICDHIDQKFNDGLRKKKSNFCEDCGKIMNYRKPKKTKKQKKKEVKNE